VQVIDICSKTYDALIKDGNKLKTRSHFFR
jgi:hypothetical protein